MGIEQPVRNLRPFLQPFANRCRNRLPRLAAQPRQFIDHDLDPAHAFDFGMLWGDVHADAQLLVHQVLHAFQVCQALQVFQAFEQFFLPGGSIAGCAGRYRAHRAIARARNHTQQVGRVGELS